MRIDIDKLPFFLTGDFNGDGNRDIAVLVKSVFTLWLASSSRPFSMPLTTGFFLLA